MHAFVMNGQVQNVGGLPASARRLDTQEWVMGLATAPVELVKATGWYPVVEERPAVGANQQWGNPTYTVRADDVLATYPVVAQAAETINEATIRSQITTALATLQAQIDTANLGAGTLSSAVLSAAARAAQAQIKDQARVLRKMLRLLDGRLDGTE